MTKTTEAVLISSSGDLRRKEEFIEEQRKVIYSTVIEITKSPNFDPKEIYTIFRYVSKAVKDHYPKPINIPVIK